MAKAADPADERPIVCEMPVATQLDEVVEQPLHVVKGVRTLEMPGELDRSPDLLRARLGLDALDLPPEPAELILNAHTSKQGELAQAREPIAQPQELVPLRP